MSTASTILDPVAIIDSLSVEEIEERLASLGREEKALRVLLRVARIRKRKTQQHDSRTQVCAGQEVPS